VNCPQCDSKRLYKDGLRYLNNGSSVQRWLCRKCGYRFSFSGGKQYSNTLSDNHRNGKYADKKPKNLSRALIALTETKEKTKSGHAGATKQITDVKGILVDFSWWMHKQGYKESTIESRGARLNRLVKLKANLFNPESVKEVIAVQENWSEARKEAMVYAYDLFAKWSNIKWEKPIYKAIRKLPFIPLEREIDDLLAGCNKYGSTFLQIAKETGARAGEIYNLTWTDINFENNTLNITPEKGSNPRLPKISKKLVAMINTIQRKNEKVFGHYKNLKNLRRTFERHRKRTAHKLGNPNLLRITFHTLRHWKATTEYNKTKDILYVMKLLGHKNIKKTLIYTQLIDQPLDEEEYISKVAKTINDARLLVEAGFEYICDIEDVKLFRKRK